MVLRHEVERGERGRFVVLADQETGELVILDTFKRRHDGLSRRLAEWSSAIHETVRRREIAVEWYGVRLSYDGKRRGMRKGDIREFIYFLRSKHGSRLVGWFWSVETHRRSVYERTAAEGRARFSDLHAHLILVVAAEEKIMQPDRPGGGWTHGATRLERLKNQSGGYLAGSSYLGKDKEYQHDYSRMIKGMRSYGCGLPRSAALRRRPEHAGAGADRYKYRRVSDDRFIGR
jgi:hypothetical protein